MITHSEHNSYTVYIHLWLSKYIVVCAIAFDRVLVLWDSVYASGWTSRRWWSRELAHGSDRTCRRATTIIGEMMCRCVFMCFTYITFVGMTGCWLVRLGAPLCQNDHLCSWLYVYIYILSGSKNIYLTHTHIHMHYTYGPLNTVYQRSLVYYNTLLRDILQI